MNQSILFLITKTFRTLHACENLGETKQLADKVENELPSRDIKGNNRNEIHEANRQF